MKTLPQRFIFIAISSDGFIAREDGDVSWLDPFNGSEEDYGYRSFFKSINTVVVGRKTFEKVVAFPGPFAYAGKAVYVLSHTVKQSKYPVRFYSGNLDVLFKRLNGPIFIDGGAETIQACHRLGLIDEYVISTVPVALGSGIKLFGGGFTLSSLVETERKVYPNGLIQVKYRKYEP